jgi:RNA polymerase sigma-70 factor (ECF subfamily)
MLTLAGFSKQMVTIPRAEEPGLIRELSDEALIRAIADGDRRALHALYLRHKVRTYRFVLRLTADAALAEDIVSEVFLDVWRQAVGFKGKSRVSTWILAIARYKALSALRRRSDEQLDDCTATAIADPADDPGMMAERQDRSRIVRKCLSQLSTTHREMLDLVYYQEKSVEEVAQIIGVPCGTVKTRMFYARKHMEKLLETAGIDRH